MIDKERYKTERSYRFGVKLGGFLGNHKFGFGVIVGWIIHVFFSWIYR